MRIRIFSLKRRRGMAGERENRILESPLYGFVKRGWLKWSQKIVSLQVRDEDFLLYLVWGYSGESYDRAVDSCVKRLRAKLDEYPHPCFSIKTIWGVGYSFAYEEKKYE